MNGLSGQNGFVLKRTAACVLAGLVLACSGWYALARPTAAAAPPPTAVGLVNLERLTQNLDELKDRNKKLEVLRQPYAKQIEDMETQIKALTAELKDTIPANDRMLRLDKEANLAELKRIHEVRVQAFKQRLEMQFGEAIRQIYAKVSAAIKEFAEREGYDLVLLDDREILIPENAQINQVNQILVEKRVLYAKGEMDITDRLITLMNSQWAAGGAGAPDADGAPNK